MRVGLVCPYTWDVPGGVQAHVRDLAVALQGLGHGVSVLAPVDDPDAADLEPWVVPAGRAVPVPYNGSIARLCFGPLSSARTRRWLRAGRFDVLHVHEPTVPSVSMLALWSARGPIVVTFHTATERSRALQVFGTALQPGLEKAHGRIAVSPAARRVITDHLGGDAVVVPNGVDVARFTGARPLPRPARLRGRPTVGFLGRIDEPRKGLAVLLEALPELARRVPDVHLLVAGPGDTGAVRAAVPPALRDRVELLGRVSEADKPRLFATGDVYCAPNTHGESFGIVLLEAMAAGTPVVASDLPAFRRVLDDGRAGVLFGVRDARGLAVALADLLRDPGRRAALRTTGCAVVQAYDWSQVTRSVVEVYESVLAAAPGARTPVVVDAAAEDAPEPHGAEQADDPDAGALRRLLTSLTGWGT